jgi:hypothetical protein
MGQKAAGCDGEGHRSNIHPGCKSTLFRVGRVMLEVCQVSVLPEDFFGGAFHPAGAVAVLSPAYARGDPALRFLAGSAGETGKATGGRGEFQEGAARI